MANVAFTFNPVPAPACYPPDLNGLAQELTTGGILAGTIPDTAGGGVYVGSTPPSSSLTNKVWYKTDSAGRPLGVYMYYSGNWRKVYTGIGLYEIRFYNGPSSSFDGTGRGIVGGDLDGWALCNGQNGTPNLQNYFICGSNTNSGAWVAAPSGLSGNASAGGIGSNTIQCGNLPDLFATSYITSMQSGTGTGVAVATNDASKSPYDIPITDLVNGCHPQGQTPFDNTPPWFAAAVIMFVGYQ